MDHFESPPSTGSTMARQTEAALGITQRSRGHAQPGLYAGARAAGHATCRRATAWQARPHRALCIPQDVVQRVGSRGAVADVTRSLCAKLAPTLLAPATAAALVGAALAAAREDGGPDFVRAVLGLLADAAAAAPSLFSGLLSPVRPYLQPRSDVTSTLLSHVPQA